MKIASSGMNNREDCLGLVRGFVWKARMANGAIFEWWTPTDVLRREAVKELLDIAGEDSYDRADILNVWKTKGEGR